MHSLARTTLMVFLAAAPAAAQQTQTLTVGRTVDRTLAARQAHDYAMPLEAGRFVAGRAVQHGVDVQVAIVGPQGDTLHKVDSPNGKQGPEPFQFTTSARGTYKIVVAALPEETGNGRYTLTVDRVVAAATTPAGKVAQLLASVTTSDPGVAVAVVRDGKILYQNAWGLANLAHKVPFTLETRHNIGSTSKQFTAFAILQLADQKKLTLDDDVRKHIPELPDLGQKVTIRNLLTHTSGYREYLNALALGGRRLDYGDYIARSEVIDLVKRQPTLQNAPGAEFNYNNTGYALMAVIVERISGKSFPEYMQENVFKPLGMTSTLVRATPGQVVPNASQGYVAFEGGYREAQDLGSSMGAGGIYTTLGDLAKWVANYRSNTVGPARFFEQMSTRNIHTKGDTSNYGLGLMIDKWRGLRRVRHGGADVAHRSALTYYPELNAAITVQSNNATVNVENYANQIAEFYFGDKLQKAPPSGPVAGGGAATPDTTKLDAYVGQFALEEAKTFILTFTRRGTRLFGQATGQPEVSLQPISDSSFSIVGVAASVIFHREPDGTVKRMTLDQNGLHPATRVDATASVAKPNFNDFVGRYFSSELEAFFEVVLEKDTLMLQSRRAEPVKLQHSKGDDFTGTFPIATLSFERDATGKVTGFRAGNGRTRNVLFQRAQ